MRRAALLCLSRGTCALFRERPTAGRASQELRLDRCGAHSEHFSRSTSGSSVETTAVARRLERQDDRDPGLRPPRGARGGNRREWVLPTVLASAGAAAL